MAEAVVDGTPTSRFFCHKCSIEIEDLLPDYSCPRCASGFIEELQSGNDNNCPTSGMDLVNDDHDYPLLNNLIERDILDLLGMPDRSQTSSTSNRNSVPVNSTNYLTIRDNRHSYSRRGRQIDPALNMFLQSFLQALSEASLAYPVTQDSQPPVLVYANPQDYIWGQAGFDAIVTHMLNQLDGTAGPPPLPRKQIDQIPTTTVTQSQVDSKMQCSVCWEDFKLSEPVRQLPCQHLYHAPCILPWLELHGTCPICRQNLGDQNTAEANQDVVRPSLSARFRATNESRNNARTSATSSSALNNSNSSDSNSSSTRSSSD
ncbi:E3 ubiquitin-protein ligase Iruka isoform X2 [Megalopta genalis]|uniref:E3 ubiquitin-protein ligase Iruka isoform X2 n=1 Tax=Megalopta genalis TaxID=115081 RepID=UPI0014436FCF|nr:E3 ubiquitin-protein ligase RNF115 isoform X2 [Megalopta genalis]